MRATFFQKLTLCLLSFSFLSANLEEDIKENLLSFSDYLQEQLNNCKGDLESFQAYLNESVWGEILPQKGEGSSVTVVDLKLNGYNRAVVASPGEAIKMLVHFMGEKQPQELTEIVLGTLTEDPKVTIVWPENCEGLGEEVLVKAPDTPGIYPLRYRVNEAGQSKGWLDKDQNPPGFSYTIGYIVVVE